MRFHVVGLAHVQTTNDFPMCAFTQKIKGFCKMMVDLNHEVYLYSGDQNQFMCSEHVKCFHEDRRKAAVGDNYIYASWSADDPHVSDVLHIQAQEIKERIAPGDFICVLGGSYAKYMMEKFPNNLVVEYGIGYPSTFSSYRVWESHAWMHASLGAMTGGNPGAAQGMFYDAVIPGYLNIHEFEPNTEKKDYFVFVGRMVQDKGVDIAAEACKRLGKELVCIGSGPFIPPGVNWIGPQGHAARNTVVRSASALFCPTRYIEPFGNVAIEAAALGTPVISTDWGAFTETVIKDYTGYRCRLLRDFISAGRNCLNGDISPTNCRVHSTKYGLTPTSRRYEKYFRDLMTLYGKGWYED